MIHIYSNFYPIIISLLIQRKQLSIKHAESVKLTEHVLFYYDTPMLNIVGKFSITVLILMWYRK